MLTVVEAPKVTKNSQGEIIVNVGFSGTRYGMSTVQKEIVKSILAGKCGQFHHGDCVGADEEVHDIIRQHFPDKWKIVIHPPIKDVRRANKVGDLILAPKHYHPRNYDIVESCNVFIACPFDMSERGGTWNTIGQFRDILEHEYSLNVNPRTGVIVLPDGTIGNIAVRKKSKLKLS